MADPICPKCKSIKFKQTKDPLYFKCEDCGKTFMLTELEVKFMEVEKNE